MVVKTNMEPNFIMSLLLSFLLYFSKEIGLP